MVLMGASEPWAADQACGEVMHAVADKGSGGAMSIIDAEVTKIAVNTFITTKISYANMIGEVCERLPAPTLQVVTSALGLDTRIGRSTSGRPPLTGVRASPGQRSVRSLARSFGASADIAEATDRVNLRQAGRFSAGQILVSAGGSHRRPWALLQTVDPCSGRVLRCAARQRASAAGSPCPPTTRRPPPSSPVSPWSEAPVGPEKADVVVVATPWPEFAGRPHLFAPCFRLLAYRPRRRLRIGPCRLPGNEAPPMRARSPV